MWLDMPLSIENVAPNDPGRLSGVWVNRGATRAKRVHDDFHLKVIRENSFQEISLEFQRKPPNYDSEASDQGELEENGETKKKSEKINFATNLVGYMLARLSSHSDDLVEKMLQSMLGYLDTDTSSRGENDCDASNASNGDDDPEKMLVFTDLAGDVWQISKVSDKHNFEELFDSAQNELNYFKPSEKPLKEQMIE